MFLRVNVDQQKYFVVFSLEDYLNTMDIFTSTSPYVQCLQVFQQNGFAPVADSTKLHCLIW